MVFSVVDYATPMESNRDDRIYDLQQMLAELPEDQWTSFLDDRCAGDTALRDEVLRRQRSLDEYERRATPPLVIAGDPGSPSSAIAGTDGSGAMIGDYRLIRKLGEGGMGIVYEAEQEHPRRLVALKVIRGGPILDALSVKLFEREAQALGRLKHSGIATIYEAGQTQQGQHFFAMELVRGTPFLDYARSIHGAAPVVLGQRLGVFCSICRAVAYAHQQGVMNRRAGSTRSTFDRTCTRSASFCMRY
jgi:serine/threonine protein kinase